MDIQNSENVHTLVDSFYDKVRRDDTIGYIFDEAIGADWSAHLPVMYQFWETVLLAAPGYRGNPVIKHIALDKKIPLTDAHFTRWLALWNETVDNLFQGSKADEAKKRALLMKDLISMKVAMARDGKTIM